MPKIMGLNILRKPNSGKHQRTHQKNTSQTLNPAIETRLEWANLLV